MIVPTWPHKIEALQVHKCGSCTLSHYKASAGLMAQLHQHDSAAPPLIVKIQPLQDILQGVAAEKEASLA